MQEKKKNNKKRFKRIKRATTLAEFQGKLRNPPRTTGSLGAEVSPGGGGSRPKMAAGGRPTRPKMADEGCGGAAHTVLQVSPAPPLRR